mgnify:CR=1 FL=1
MKPNGEWGVFVFVSATREGAAQREWGEVMADQKMIFIGPNGIGNARPSALRIGVALDALATVQEGWDVDPGRFVIGGFSGGGAIATMMGAHYPDVFLGTVDMCRAVMWETHEISTMPGSAFGDGEISHLDPGGLASLDNGHRFAFISGEADILPVGDEQFSNYEGILKGMGDWWARDLRARMWDVPGLAHRMAPGDPFASALNWVLTCTDEGAYPTRFNSDHRPPLTPVETPAVAPPPACDAGDPGDPGDDPDAESDGEADQGCGCQSAPGPALRSIALPLFLSPRRSSKAPKAGQ